MIRVLGTLILSGAVAAAGAAQNGRTPVKPPVVRPTPVPAQVVIPTPAKPMKLENLEALRALEALDIDKHKLKMNDDELRELRDAQKEASRAMSEQMREATREWAQAASEAIVYAPKVMPQVVPQVVPQVYPAPAATTQVWSNSDGFFYNSNSFGPRYQADPADTLYQRASQLFSDKDYRAAAQRYKELRQKYPNSRYTAQAMYWQAFAQYRLGSEADLREALAVLEDQQKQFPNARFQTVNNNGMSDINGLTNRIRAALAERGDSRARADLNSSATGGGMRCDSERQLVQTEALSALRRIDPDAANQKLTEILGRKDECYAELRRSALSILSAAGDQRAVNTLLDIAKNDPSPSMRQNAIGFVVRFPSEEVLSTLESIAKNEQNDDVRRTAARALVGYPAPRAKQIVRTIVEDNSASDRIRTEIVSRFNEETGSAEDASWMRSIYPRITSQQVRASLVRAIGRIGGAESQRFLMDLSVSDQETVNTRSEAFRLVSRSMSTADLSRNYDQAGSRPMRMRIVEALNSRKEPEALDKIIDIARKSTDPEITKYIIQLLMQRDKDPKVTALFAELIAK